MGCGAVGCCQFVRVVKAKPKVQKVEKVEEGVIGLGS